MTYEQHYVLNVLIPSVEREGLTIKTKYGEVTINSGSQSVINFIHALTEELKKPQKKQSPYIPF